MIKEHIKDFSRQEIHYGDKKANQCQSSKALTLNKASWSFKIASPLATIKSSYLLYNIKLQRDLASATCIQQRKTLVDQARVRLGALPNLESQGCDRHPRRNLHLPAIHCFQAKLPHLKSYLSFNHYPGCLAFLKKILSLNASSITFFSCNI